MSGCWDGGELEDFHRSAGSFFELYPHAFLQIVKENKVPDSRLRYMFTMLPVQTVDDIDLSISVVENRIAILNRISDKAFEEVKFSGLFYLRKFKKSLVGIKMELEKTK